MVPRVSLAVDPRALGEFVDTDRVAKLLSEAPNSDLTQDEISAKAAFLSAKVRVDRGEEPSLPDFEEPETWLKRF